MRPLEFRSYLFVCGLHRTGTSLLARMLAAHPQKDGIREAPVPEHEGAYLCLFATSLPPCAPRARRLSASLTNHKRGTAARGIRYSDQGFLRFQRVDM